MILPKNYQWLALENSPRHLLKAIELYGTTEVVGIKNNPVIMSWAEELSLKQYNNDDIPWCGLYIGVIMKRAGRQVVKDPLWARNWANFGVAVKEPMLGDVLVFSRESGGHVGLYIGEDKASYHVLGGNQGNAVSVTRILKERLIASRRPDYMQQPLNIRKIKLDSRGVTLSIDEA